MGPLFLSYSMIHTTTKNLGKFPFTTPEIRRFIIKTSITSHWMIRLLLSCPTGNFCGFWTDFEKLILLNNQWDSQILRLDKKLLQFRNIYRYIVVIFTLFLALSKNIILYRLHKLSAQLWPCYWLPHFIKCDKTTPRYIRHIRISKTHLNLDTTNI